MRPSVSCRLIATDHSSRNYKRQVRCVSWRSCPPPCLRSAFIIVPTIVESSPFARYSYSSSIAAVHLDTVEAAVAVIAAAEIHRPPAAHVPFEKVKTGIDLYNSRTVQGRSVLLTLEALNLEVNIKHIDLLAEVQIDHLLPFFYLRSAPVIVDGDFMLSDGHAIIAYLVRKYGDKDDHPLYPKNSKIKAQINQILHFDNGTLFPALKNLYSMWIFYRIPKTKENEDTLHEALEFLENVLKKFPWAAGESMTVADFSLVASISTFKAFGVDLQKYDKINEWLTKCTNTMNGYKEVNQAGINELETRLKALDEKLANIPQTQSL